DLQVLMRSLRDGNQTTSGRPAGRPKLDHDFVAILHSLPPLDRMADNSPAYGADNHSGSAVLPFCDVVAEDAAGDCAYKGTHCRSLPNDSDRTDRHDNTHLGI